MRDTLAEIHELRNACLIGQWAIGRAMGATFYLEPVFTYDLDIFVLFEGAPLILTLTPVYEFLKTRGHLPDGDAVMVCGWPVQFLPAESGLLREAVESAQEVNFEGISARVMRAEHLMAIALQTARGKDFARLVAFTEAGVAEESRLSDILERHELSAAWARFRQNYLTPGPP